MVLTSGGSVGIGTTSPGEPLDVRAATNQRVTVVANVNGLDSASVGIMSLNDAYNAYEPLSFLGSRFNFVGGNVGIGTTTPARQLHVVVSDSATTTISYPLRVTHKTSGTAGDDLGTGIEFEVQNPSGTMDTIGTYEGYRWADTSGTSTWWQMEMLTGGVETTPIDWGTWQGGAAGSFVSEFDITSIANEQPYLVLLRGNGTQSAPTTVANGDVLGTLQWEGYDGTADRAPAQIIAVVNGTVATNSIPTDIAFDTGSTAGGSERMRITSAGLVGIGTTGPGVALDVNGEIRVGSSATSCAATTALCIGYTGGAGMYGIDLKSGTTGPTDALYFENYLGSVQGSITVTNSAVAYNTTSDRRLKENIALTARGLDALLKISVNDFNFIEDPKKARVQGFIAQDLYKLYPEAVAVGGDDAKKKPWGVDYGRLTPLLVRSLQELKTLFDGDHEEIVRLKADNDNLHAVNNSEAAEIKSEAAQINALTARLDAIEHRRH